MGTKRARIGNAKPEGQEAVHDMVKRSGDESLQKRREIRIDINAILIEQKSRQRRTKRACICDAKPEAEDTETIRADTGA